MSGCVPAISRIPPSFRPSGERRNPLSPDIWSPVGSEPGVRSGQDRRPFVVSPSNHHLGEVWSLAAATFHGGPSRASGRTGGGAASSTATVHGEPTANRPLSTKRTGATTPVDTVRLPRQLASPRAAIGPSSPGLSRSPQAAETFCTRLPRPQVFFDRSQSHPRHA